MGSHLYSLQWIISVSSCQIRLRRDASTGRLFTHSLLVLAVSLFQIASNVTPCPALHPPNVK